MTFGSASARTSSLHSQAAAAPDAAAESWPQAELSGDKGLTAMPCKPPVEASTGIFFSLQFSASIFDYVEHSQTLGVSSIWPSEDTKVPTGLIDVGQRVTAKSSSLAGTSPCGCCLPPGLTQYPQRGLSANRAVFLLH